MLAVIDDTGVARRRSGLEEHQPEPRAGDMADKPRIDAVAARLALDDAPERPVRDARHPGGAAAQTRQQAGDVQLAAADPDLEDARLIEPLHAGRRQTQQRLSQCQEVVARDRRRRIGIATVTGPGAVRIPVRSVRADSQGDCESHSARTAGDVDHLARTRTRPRRCTERR